MRTVLNLIANLIATATLTGCNVYHRTTCVTLESDLKAANAWAVEIAVCYDEDSGRCYAFSLKNGGKGEFIGTLPCDDESEPLVVSR